MQNFNNYNMQVCDLNYASPRYETIHILGTKDIWILLVKAILNHLGSHQLNMGLSIMAYESISKS